jgi:2-amino-4-hydroxy-6-hydroxymethyldihydropteridine diphosphokinase
MQEALHHLSEIGKVKRTSFLYETPPMYYSDQEKFLNAACHIKTNLDPPKLLEALKAIEERIGRKQSFRNGPRLIDLDIILHGSGSWNTADLQIPHARLHERAFVLRPLCDIDPDLMHPILHRSMGDLLRSLPKEDIQSIRQVTPMGRDANGKMQLVELGKKAFVCGILNVTPDR